MEGEKLRLTVHGQVVRQEVEETTDRYFYTAWAHLNKADLGTMENLLRQLHDTLRQSEV